MGELANGLANGMLLKGLTEANGAPVVGGGVGSSDMRKSSFQSANAPPTIGRSAFARIVELLGTGGSMISTESSSPRW